MDGVKLLHLLVPGKLSEGTAFMVGVLAMLAVFLLNLAVYESSARVYVLYVLPLLFIGIHSSRRAVYLVGILVALSFECACFVFHNEPWPVLIGNLFLEVVVAGFCLVVAESARLNYLRVVSLAGTDELTGLLNRRAFARIVRQEIDRHERYGGEFSILMLDLDGFKALNDTRGHLAGDQALRRVAELLRTGVRGSDSVARFGGDEFVVLLPSTSRDASRTLGEQLCEAIARYMAAAGYAVTASIGTRTFGDPPASVDKVLKMVDDAMYVAKQAGGNSVVSA